MSSLTTPTSPPPISVFISYSHKDEDLREELDVHLANLKRQGKIQAWHDRAIEAGAEWDAAIKHQLETAQVILLLISPRFIASNYCYDLEMQRAVERHDEGTARVIPIILKPCDWQDSPFSKLQVLPKDAKPITKWDDQDEAFLNVVQGIRRAVASLETETKKALGATLNSPEAIVPFTSSTPTPHTPHPTPCLSTPLLSTYDAATWVGREQLITDLTQKLRDGYRMLAITGITGIGKTALAERLVVEVSENGIPFHRLNFDDRGQGRDFLSGALTLLPKLGETVTTEDQKAPQNALKHLLHTLRNHRFLVQIDSLEMLLQGDEQTGWNAFTDSLWVDFFQQLLAGDTCQSQLLLTSQALPEELEMVGSRYPRSWHRQDLGGLTEVEQLQLFEKYGLKPDGLDSEVLQRFVELYQGHPLVLQVIARDILEKPFNGNVQQYWQRYQAEFDQMVRHQKGNSPRALQLRVKQRVEQALQRLPVDARHMLCRSSVYRRPVPEEFWLAMMEELPEDQQWSALELLKSHNLAEQELRGDGVLLLRQHNLVRSVSRKLLKDDRAAWQRAERKAAQVWLDNYEPEPDAPKLEQVRGKLEAFHHYCEVEEWEAAKEICIDQKVDVQLLRWGYSQELLSLCEPLLGKLDASVDEQCETGIGNAYWSIGKRSQAIDHFQRSLAIARKLGDRGSEGNALGNLGSTYWYRGDYPQAIEYYQQALTIARETDDRRVEVRMLSNLGGTYRELGNYPEAIQYCQQALIIAREFNVPSGELWALRRLGDIYKDLSDYPQAIEYYQQALTIARETDSRGGEAWTLEDLGEVYKDLGDYSQAIEYYQQSLTIAREIGNSLREGTALFNWGAILLKLEQYSEAQQPLQLSLNIFKSLDDLEGEADALLRLGELHYKTGQLDQAREFCDRALALATELGVPLVKECEELQLKIENKKLKEET
ncbi:tetratricopeptide repeat protein [Kovacikia minuta CCNUW1]|uniref:tetratricopeptide repeat protein n=1 Tax=Kovacikia minuta TaxID=2931930 RepID=UPI001CCFCFFC|nr:tetratricopeptide repeat protein [Kovacikia minuta]UBF24465.1 tetratricopeptide repeat protein [Kovacikia minuta CCNUW1]